MAWKQLLSQEYILPNSVKIFDTTLRDGEQTPGVALTTEAKVRVAEALDELGVDIIEAGFPVVSEGELKSVKTIAGLGLNAKICALARTSVRDIDAALKADVDWIHLFIATSDIHLKHKLHMTREQAVGFAVSMVEYAKSHGVTVHFSAEDATRTEPGFLVQVFKAVEDAGADSIDIPDTTGSAIPAAMHYLVGTVRKALKIPIAVHCHDDMGLAVANSLAGVEAGAEIIHVTVNGLGERAGNTSLEEVVVALHKLYGISTGIKLEKLYRVSRLVEKLTGIIVPKNKAVVGDNAFAHESGIHVHGILGSPETYEPITPELVGRKRRIVLGKHSGIHSVKALAEQFGLNLDDKSLKLVLTEIKAIGDTGGKVTESLFLEIVRKVAGEAFKARRLNLLEVKLAGNHENQTAILLVKRDGIIELHGGSGSSSVNAVLDAGINLVKELGDYRILDYKIWPAYSAVGGCSEAEVILAGDGEETMGRGVHSEPAAALAHAIVNASEQLLAFKKVEEVKS